MTGGIGIFGERKRRTFIKTGSACQGGYHSPSGPRMSIKTFMHLQMNCHKCAQDFDVFNIQNITVYDYRTIQQTVSHPDVN